MYWHGCIDLCMPYRALQTQEISLFGYEPECCMTTARGRYCGFRFREVRLLTIHLNPIIEVSFPWQPGAHYHSACSGVAPLSLVVSISGKNNPGGQGMQVWLRLLFRMAHVFHLSGDSYRSLCNHHSLLCAATWLQHCDWEGVGWRWDRLYRLGPQWGWRNCKRKY